MSQFEYVIPIRTVSEANCSQHWTKQRKRHKQQQFFVRASLSKLKEPICLPCTVILTRQSPRTLDEKDNLPMAFKWIADEIADFIFPEKLKFYKNKNGKMVPMKGRSDSDIRIKWDYKQEKCSKYGVKIEII